MYGQVNNQTNIYFLFCLNNKREIFTKSLVEELKSEIGGHFLQGVLGLLTQTDEFNASCVHKAIKVNLFEHFWMKIILINALLKGLGTDEETLIELLCTREGSEIQKLAEAYKKCNIIQFWQMFVCKPANTFQQGFNRDLSKDIEGDLSGDLGKVLISITSGFRQQNNVPDLDLAAKEAEELYKVISRLRRRIFVIFEWNFF